MPDGEDLSERQLKFARWYVSRARLLGRLGFGLLAIFDVLTLGYGLFGYADYFLISWNQDLALRSQAARPLISQEAVLRQGPQPLVPVSLDIFKSGQGRYDFLARLGNPNQNWGASFYYRFETPAGSTEEREGFILPGEEKYLAALAETFPTPPGRAEFNPTRISWRRLDRQVVRDPAIWREERLNFLTTNVRHESALAIDRKLGRTSFEVENRTAYGYWRVGFYIVLLAGSSPRAVNFITLDNFEAGERRRVEVNWFEPLPQTNQVSLQPEINLLDPQVYLPWRAN